MTENQLCENLVFRRKDKGGELAYIRGCKQHFGYEIKGDMDTWVFGEDLSKQEYMTKWRQSCQAVREEVQSTLAL